MARQFPSLKEALASKPQVLGGGLYTASWYVLDAYMRAGFDFVNIDTEGTSVEVLHRLFMLGKTPKCICVEHDERTTEAMAAATALGYACTYVNGENLVLVR